MKLKEDKYQIPKFALSDKKQIKIFYQKLDKIFQDNTKLREFILEIIKIRKPNNFATFQIESNKAILSDPVYTYDSKKKMKGLILNRSCKTKSGKWKGFYIDIVRKRPNIIVWIHNDYQIHKLKWIFSKHQFVVDSGQVVFADLKYYRDDNLVKKSKENKPNNMPGELWYEYVSTITLKKRAGMIPYGYASRTGFGDGFYPYMIATDHGQLIGLIAICL